MSARPALTQALLAERIDNPVRQGGATVVDLTGFNIDLRPEQRLDKGTKPADFSEQFYQQLQTEPDKAAALRQAMLSTLAEHPDPRDWAAFFLIGL